MTQNKNTSIRRTVLRSLSAFEAIKDAEFYANLFASQTPEGFALIVTDPRALKNPLLDALTSNLQILSELGLTPIILIGALDDDRMSIKFQAQRLQKTLEGLSIRTAKLNTASYGLIPDVRQKAHSGIMTILEMTERRGKMNLASLITEFKPSKVIFLQPSGGLSHNDKRIPVVNIDKIETQVNIDTLSAGQLRFINIVKELSDVSDYKTTYVMASPLNLLRELFTTKGSGTMFRKGAKITTQTTLTRNQKLSLKTSIEAAFERQLKADYFTHPIHKVFYDDQYRGGAIFTQREELIYLSKFWVTQAARGEGIARDIWDMMTHHTPAFFWRSRMNNNFNDWYMRACDGMQIKNTWRIFWKGLEANDIAKAIELSAHSHEDFV